MAEYITNVEAEEIAAQLIPIYHNRLTGIKIAHLLKVKPAPKASKKPKKQPRQGKKIVIAKASKVSPKTMALAEKDVRFVIEYDSNIWDAMPDDKKTAVVDHELCHCGNDADGVYMINHSVEEFREIIERHGFWKDDVQQFAATVESVTHAEESADVEVPFTEEVALEQSGN